MNPQPTCAAPGCDNPLPDTAGPGHRVYCSQRCWPSRKPRARARLEVETVENDNDEEHRSPRSWTVQLRRGPDTFIVGKDLGRFSATAIERELRQVIHPDRQEGDTTG